LDADRLRLLIGAGRGEPPAVHLPAPLAVVLELMISELRQPELERLAFEVGDLNILRVALEEERLRRLLFRKLAVLRADLPLPAVAEIEVDQHVHAHTLDAGAELVERELDVFVAFDFNADRAAAVVLQDHARAVALLADELGL